MHKLSLIAFIRTAACCVILAGVPIDAAHAQGRAPDPFPNKSAAQLLATYRGGMANSTQGQEILVAILNKGCQRPKQMSTWSGTPWPRPAPRMTRCSS